MDDTHKALQYWYQKANQLKKENDLLKKQIEHLNQGRIVLSENDWKKFEETLANPPPPSKKLIEARRKYLESKIKE